ncbi:MAG TPA: thiamine ABC transporter substrate-binding protein [Acidimicrobiia bacterium]|nr:thiamine ABC transporter substrate-binding protein [Acidimicrobiia bacterium]
MKRPLAVVATLAIALSACSSSTKGSPGSPTSAAPGSKTVVLLTHDAFAVTASVLKAFTRQTGYKVKVLKRGDAGVMLNEAILRKDHPEADVLFGVDNTFLSRALDAGLFVSYHAHGVDAVPQKFRMDPQERVTPIDNGDVCLNYDNTYFGRNGHPPAPTKLDDLIDSRYKNLTVVESAAASSPGLAFLLATIAAKGDGAWQDYWRKLRANGVRVVNDWTAAYEQDFTAGGGNGDRPIVVSYASSPPADVVYSDPHRDTPRVGVVDASCFRQIEFAGVLAHASNQPGAQALVDFMLSRTFQADMPLQMYVNPVVPGTPLPDVFVRWAAKPAYPFTIDPATIGAQRDGWIKQWTDIAVH